MKRKRWLGHTMTGFTLYGATLLLLQHYKTSEWQNEKWLNETISVSVKGEWIMYQWLIVNVIGINGNDHRLHALRTRFESEKSWLLLLNFIKTKVSFVQCQWTICQMNACHRPISTRMCVCVLVHDWLTPKPITHIWINFMCIFLSIVACGAIVRKQANEHLR